MNEKLNEVLRDALGSLTDEQKEKVKGCQDGESLVKALSELGVELPDDLLDDVAGGLIYRVHEHIYRHGKDEIGKVLGYLVVNDADIDEGFEVVSEADAIALADKLGWKNNIEDL